ncbi:hypothetical protein AX17_007225 [Amanita inopinata Kibby_2008]|nr:hypothetical protein AX17_007225 [Amanita inopinata Kibby_2008]
MLPTTGASYLRRCVRSIYGNGPRDGELSFQSCFETRGKGKLYSMQPATAIKRPLEMFLSTYEAAKASKSIRNVLQDPTREDEREKFLINLHPAHRLAFKQFWATGILSPFSFDVGEFTHPNRLSFTAQGDWLGPSAFNPLRGHIVSRVLESGAKHKVEPADIMGCLFFHLKDELKEFAERVKLFSINIHLTQYNAKLLSRGITINALPFFKGHRFDRIDLSNVMDDVGIHEGTNGWGSLLNERNEHACIIMRSEKWFATQPKAIARAHPRILDLLRRKCQSLSLSHPPFGRILAQDIRSPVLSRLIHSLDAFLDHENAFQEFLRQHGIEGVLKTSGLRLRSTHKVHPKRYGVCLESANKLPEVSKDEFYNIFTIGAADFPVRFIELENDRRMK